MSEKNPWLLYSPEEADAALAEIIARVKALEGLKYEGELTVIEVTRTQGLTEDTERKRRIQELFRCFPEDIRRLLALLGLTQTTTKHLEEELASANATLETLHSFGQLAARLFYKAKEQGLKNFIRQRIGDPETREVFTIEVRREHLTPEETDAFFATSQKLGEEP